MLPDVILVVGGFIVGACLTLIFCRHWEPFQD